MSLSHGDFSRLAGDYAAHRPGYAPGVAERLVRAATPPDGRTPELVDVGAGTGIWTRQLAAAGGPVIAVEPDDAMRAHGERDSRGYPIAWRAGSAEDTGLASTSCDLVTMASSFHWTDFERALAELRRVLRPGGLFAALWNTRVLGAHPLFVEIEAELRRRVPELERVSSGQSAFCEGLHARLRTVEGFDCVDGFEAEHVERMTPERYVGIWRSVNDVRVQAGEARFADFLRWVEARMEGVGAIEATYRTRVWTARARAS